MSKEQKFVISLIIIMSIMMWIVISFAQDTLQRHYLMPPYRGQISGYSDWTIPENAWNELINCYVDEQGKIIMRPGFYCWKDSVDTTKEILGAYEYTKQIEGGSRTYLILNTNQRIYRTDRYYNTINTDISGGLIFSDDSIPQFDIFYNMLFMANSENNPIMYDQDANIIQIGVSTYSGAITFEDTNEVVTTNGVLFDTIDYHFRVGMDLIIEDSNNNGTYELISVDSNVLIIKNTDGTDVDLDEQTDSSVTLTALGIPDSLSTSRSEAITANTGYATQFTNDYPPDNYEYINAPYIEFANAGFTIGTSITISGSDVNDGTYTIMDISVGGNPYVILVDGTVTDDIDYTVPITFTGSKTIASGNSFNPICLVGHKGRLFAGGTKELPTYLFWSRSRYATQYFYDLWRDRYGQNDGTGYYDLQDKIIALEPNYNGMLVIFCENSILFLRGDDPGFDKLTPNQEFVFQPVPITKKIGIIGPNAKKRIGSDIYFYSKQGLQQLSMIIQQNTLATNLISLPIKNLHKVITNDMVLRKTNFEFLSYLNTLFMLFRGTYTSSLNDLVLCYNLNNNSFSTFEFLSSSEPIYFFEANGFNEDPNISDIIYREADPARSLWFSSEDGKLFSLHKGFPYDIDYEDPNNESLNSITMTTISAKLNLGQPFLEKQFQRSVFLCSPQINYDNTSQGQVSFYRKIDDGSWSTVVTKSFDQHTESDGTAIDYYQYLDAGVGFRGQGKTIQYKISVSGTTGRFGLEFLGAMIEWIPVDTRI